MRDKEVRSKEVLRTKYWATPVFMGIKQSTISQRRCDRSNQCVKKKKKTNKPKRIMSERPGVREFKERVVVSI